MGKGKALELHFTTPSRAAIQQHSSASASASASNTAAQYDAAD